MLAENDTQVRTFNTQLADLTKYLAGERDDFTKALNLLATALGDVGAFVRDNRDALSSNVHGLTEITKVLNDTKTAQAQILSYLPIAASNLDQAYDPDSGTLTLRRTSPTCRTRSARRASWPTSASSCPATRSSRRSRRRSARCSRNAPTSPSRSPTACACPR